MAGFLANIAQISYMLAKGRRKTKFDITLLSLSVADAFSALFVSCYGLFLVAFHKLFAVVNVRFLDIGLNICITASMTHMILIATQRLIGAVFPLKAQRIITTSRLYISLLVVWGLPCLYGILSYFFMTQSQTIRTNAILAIVSCLFLIIQYSIISFRVTRYNVVLQRRPQNRSILVHSFLVTMAFFISFAMFAITEMVSQTTTLTLHIIIGDLLVATNPLLDTLVYFTIHLCRNNRVHHTRR